MGKASKARRKSKRQDKKRAVKAQRRALYASYAQAGNRKKSKRFIMKSYSQRKVKLIDHPNGECGNGACLKCYPEQGKLVKGSTVSLAMYERMVA